MMADLAAGYQQTVTAVNLAHLRELTGLDPIWDSIPQLKRALPVKEVPLGEEWRTGLLDKLLAYLIFVIFFTPPYFLSL